MVVIAAGAIAATEFRHEKLRALAASALLATEAADYLVRKGIPFRQAHDLVGKLLREAEKQGKIGLNFLSPSCKKISPEIGPDFAKVSLSRPLLPQKSPRWNLSRFRSRRNRRPGKTNSRNRSNQVTQAPPKRPPQRLPLCRHRLRPQKKPALSISPFFPATFPLRPPPSSRKISS